MYAKNAIETKNEGKFKNKKTIETAKDPAIGMSFPWIDLTLNFHF